MFLMIDNYDSFVYNLVRDFEELNQDVAVYKNDSLSIKEINKMNLEGIIISPGPKTPEEAGISLDIINTFKGRIPILGICLGHQVIGCAFGASIVKAQEPVHGKLSYVTHNNNGIFKDIKNPLSVTRYHSLIVDKSTLPDCLEITCETKEGVIMGLRHKNYIIESVQFHPEALLTECGKDILNNFIKLCKGANK